jgi:hypothetical protein
MFALLALLLAPLAPAAPGADSAFPGGVLDSTGRTVYLAAEQGIVAIDLAGGDVRWRSDEASEPLFVVGDRLYALAPSRAGRLFVRALDLAGRGQRLSEADPIELPRWATPENAPGRSFSFAWKRQRNQLELSWQVAAWADGSPRKESSGAAVIDLETGKSRQQAATAAPAETMPAVLQRQAVRWHESAGGRLRAVVCEEQSGSSAYRRQLALVLRSWDERSGKQGEPVELMSGSNPVLMPDANGRRLWLREGTASPDRDVKEPPRWLVVDVGDGAAVARVPVVPGTTAATLHDRRAYFLTLAAVKTARDQTPRKSRSLVAVDLASGKVLWRRVLR